MVNQWMDRPYPTIADINNDKKNELLVATWNYDTPNPGRIFAWDASAKLVDGFPIKTTGHIHGRLALGDLDKDGKLEIVGDVNSFEKNVEAKVYVWRSDGTRFPGWPQNTACYPVTSGQYCSISSIVIADIDGDTNLDIIVSTDNRNIYNADESLVVPNLYAWHSNGELFTGNWPIEDDRNAGITGTIAIGDLDNNGKPDIATGRDYNMLFAYDHLGHNLPGWPFWTFYPYDSLDFRDDRISFYRSGVSLSDLDENGELEYIVNGLRTDPLGKLLGTDLLVYNTNGKRWANWELPASGGAILDDKTYRMLESPVIGDINYDGSPDIVVATEDGWIRAYTIEKIKLWEFYYAQGKILRATEPVIGDVDADGFNEVLFVTYDIDYRTGGPFGIWILEHTGVVKPGTPLIVNDPFYTTQLGISGGPTLADLDGDGKIEIAAVTWGGTVYVWDTPGLALPERMPWPMPRHDLQRTAFYQELSPHFNQSKKTVNPSNASFNETVTFTIHIARTGATLDGPITLTDYIPEGLEYIHNSLGATAGNVYAESDRKLTWIGEGSLFDTNTVDVWFRAKVSIKTATTISNIAILNAGSAGEYELPVIMIANGDKFYLPVIRREER